MYVLVWLCVHMRGNENMNVFNVNIGRLCVCVCVLSYTGYIFNVCVLSMCVSLVYEYLHGVVCVYSVCHHFCTNNPILGVCVFVCVCCLVYKQSSEGWWWDVERSWL